jgi:mono/diheme cytochrome c family protein
MHSMNNRSIIIAGVSAFALAGCLMGATDTGNTAQKGQLVYAKECSQCHGSRGQGSGDAALALAFAAPDLTLLKQRNDGVFSRDGVRRFVMGLPIDNDRLAPMPKFAAVGLRHVYPDGGADGEVLEADFDDLLDYLESIQL